MMALIIGGSGSGKSEYAENLAVSLGEGIRLYLATMKPWDEECKTRILRHKKMREKKQFETAECYRSLKKLVIKKKPKTILLECMSNLVSNELFGLWEKGDVPVLNGNSAIKEILEGIQCIKNQTEHLIVVTNDVFSDGDFYSRETKEYIRVLGELNQAVSGMSDLVVEVVAGIPIKVKEGTN